MPTERTAATPERDRSELLLNVNNAVIAHLDLNELMKSVSASLLDILPHTAAGIALYDAERDQLCENANIAYPGYDNYPQGTVFPLAGTSAGLVFTSGQPLLLRRSDAERFPADWTPRPDEKIPTSACLVPLISHGRKLGILGVGGSQEDSFTEDDLELLAQIAGQVAIAVENALNFERARNAEQDVKRQFERLRLMLEVNNAAITQLDLRELVRVISACLCEALELAFVGLALYDPEADCLRAYYYDLPDTMPPLEAGTPLPLAGGLGGQAFNSGQPAFINRASEAEAFPASKKIFYDHGVNAGGCVPLIVQGRKLGVLGVGSFQEGAFPAERQQLLSQLAGQIAIAVENSLNFERAQQAEQESRRQFERLRLMLEVNNATVTQLDLRELVRVISDCLREALQLAIAGVSLYDAEADCLRAYYYDLPDTLTPIAPGTPLPLEGSIAGRTFTTGQPVLLNRDEQWDAFPVSKRLFFQTGIHSGGCVPLIVQGRKLGVLGVDSYQQDAFPPERQQLLCQIADQLALAVDNVLNFERARQAEREVQRQLERERLMLEINNAVVSELSLRELFRVISAKTREVMGNDTTSVAVYDPESNRLRAYLFDQPDNMPAIEEGTLIPLEGTMGGRAFSSGQPVFLNRGVVERASADFDKALVEAGIRSGGCVPLIAHGRKLGILGIGSFREDAFSEADQELFGHIANQIAIAVENALAYHEIETLKNKLTEEKLYLEEEINTAYNFEEIIGSSPALKRILKQVETVAPTDSTVLIQGETGTGKELIARAIHNLSARRQRTLVKLNCAAIPTGLLESELFGHEKGSFTGAIAQRVGRFELAHKGTMFLDEVGEIPLELQPKLLRVLQEQEFERLGNARTQRVDVRLIAATNRDLAAMSAENRYRSDLYYRLNVFPITIPPLRERPEDIPLLARFFANKFAGRMKKQIKTIPAEAVAALQQYHWPGNIRELENMIERAVILTQGAELNIPLPEIPAPAKAAVAAPQAAPAAPRSPAPPASTDSTSLEAIEREHILRTLRETNWVVGGPSGAAARLGMKRTTLQNRMVKLGIARPG
ncbi:MAG: sigma 54-interacting transcriptional regulator [Verrucomicrobiales bacterium]|nr:sigma 54-interacting transcriptional regulator [Verrucomicrobiales bacterium]